MIDRRIEELMWLEIDDSISPSDRRELHAYLESHDEALRHFEQLRRMTMLFGQVGEIDPPPELRQRILRSLESATPPSAAPARTSAPVAVWDWICGFFAPRPVLKTAAAVVMGVFIGVIGYHLVRYEVTVNEPLDILQFSGTMGLSSVDQSKPVLNIEAPGVSGALSLHRVQSRVLSQLDVRSEGEIEVVLGYGGRALSFTGGKLSDHPSNQVTVEDREIRIRNTGDGEYQFLFEVDENPKAQFLVQVMSEGEVLFDRKLTPAYPNGKR